MTSNLSRREGGAAKQPVRNRLDFSLSLSYTCHLVSFSGLPPHDATTKRPPACPFTFRQGNGECALSRPPMICPFSSVPAKQHSPHLRGCIADFFSVTTR